MPNSKKGNFIIDQFGAAARLVNEWRDTLLYSTLVTGGIAIAMHQKPLCEFFGNSVGNPMLALVATAAVGSLREAARLKAWENPAPMVIAGHGVSGPPNTHQLRMAVMFVGTSLLSYPYSPILLQAFKTQNHFATAFYCFSFAKIVHANVTSFISAGGPNGIYRAYKDIMWDYPRKNGGGGMTQTRKLLDGIFGRDKKEIPNELVPNPTTLSYMRALPAATKKALG